MTKTWQNLQALLQWTHLKKSNLLQNCLKIWPQHHAAAIFVCFNHLLTANKTEAFVHAMLPPPAPTTAHRQLCFGGAIPSATLRKNSKCKKPQAGSSA